MSVLKAGVLWSLRSFRCGGFWGIGWRCEKRWFCERFLDRLGACKARKRLLGFLDLEAGVAELADALDSKSGIRKGVWVRAPPPALLKKPQTLCG